MDLAKKKNNKSRFARFLLSSLRSPFSSKPNSNCVPSFRSPLAMLAPRDRFYFIATNYMMWIIVHFLQFIVRLLLCNISCSAKSTDKFVEEPTAGVHQHQHTNMIKYQFGECELLTPIRWWNDWHGTTARFQIYIKWFRVMTLANLCNFQFSIQNVVCVCGIDSMHSRFH